LAKRSHKVIFDANDRFISEADVKLNTASVSNAHKVMINNFMMNDRYGGLAVCQGKGKSTSSEHCKQLKTY